MGCRTLHRDTRGSRESGHAAAEVRRPALGRAAVAIRLASGGAGVQGGHRGGGRQRPSQRRAAAGCRGGDREGAGLRVIRTMQIHRSIALVTVVLLALIAGTLATVKLTTDHLLYQSATSTARSWAQYVA